jgi:protein ImuB
MRRIVAIVLPELACEIALRRRAEVGKPVTGPLAVLLVPDGGGPTVLDTATLDLVGEEALRHGVRPGQRVSEALPFCSSLAVERVTHAILDGALGSVAEIALGFAPTAAIRLSTSSTQAGLPRTPWGDAPFDTVWLDATGSAHLVGGEAALLAALDGRIAALGHRAQLAIAEGPRLAQALARWSPGVVIAAEPAAAEPAIACLPLQALPFDAETLRFFVGLGLRTARDLARLPRSGLAARLGANAARILDLIAGRDNLPLVPYAPPPVIVEEATFDDGIEGSEALVFVLRGMVSRAAARLLARGQACTRIEVHIPVDASVARLRDAATAGDGPTGSVDFHVDFPAPLVHEGDLLRALRARLERTVLVAPAVGLCLRIPRIVAGPQTQLDLSRDRGTDPDSLPSLLAELSAEMGQDHVGLLSVVDSHLPEARSQLVPVALARASRGTQATTAARAPWPPALPDDDEVPMPTRLLPTPISLGRVATGSVVHLDPRQPALTLEGFHFLMRLDQVEWWTTTPTVRDYARAYVTGGDAHNGARTRQGAGANRVSGEALVFFDRRTGHVFLQGWYE